MYHGDHARTIARAASTTLFTSMEREALAERQILRGAAVARLTAFAKATAVRRSFSGGGSLALHDDQSALAIHDLEPVQRDAETTRVRAWRVRAIQAREVEKRQPRRDGNPRNRIVAPVGAD